MKNFNILGVHRKTEKSVYWLIGLFINLFFCGGGGSYKKRIYWGDCLKRKLGQFADLGEGGVFEGGGGSGRRQNICHH